ncbi:unnamed protein product [Cercopithifilaria johnstoni]|uniref:INO80 complex subunit E N-terminal domain-containing protein n=1 Tax=Cercopithifilaria johnstoni TaxID=2874296 RepID=A0A8J2Q0I0_9BILA|nr:unnamed protein product [Cercopithifilaria johnstoni]
MLESEQQQQLTDNRSLVGCHQSTPVTGQQQQLTFLVTTQQPLPSVGHVIGQQQSVQNQSCYMSTGQMTSALNCVPSPVPSRTTTSTPHTHSSAVSSPSPLSVQSTSGGQCSVQLRGTASCPPQPLNPSPLSSTRVNALSPLQTSSNATATVPHFHRQHSVSFTPDGSSRAEHLRSATSRNFDGEYDNTHQQQPIMCDASSQQMHHTLQLQQARQQHVLQSSRIQQHQQQLQQKCLKQPTTLNQQGQHQNLQLQQQHCQQQQVLQQQHCQQPQILQQQQLQVLQQPQQQNFPHQSQIIQQKQQVQAQQVQQSQQLQMQSQHGYVQFPQQKQLKKHSTQQRDDDDDEEEDVQQRPSTAKEEYRELKHRFKFLVYENECYQEELRNLQRKLLKLSRDKNFLLDRLLLYEKLSDSSDESDSSVKTVEEKAPPKKKSRPPASRRRSTNVRSKGASTSCIDSDTTKISLTEQQQQQMQKQLLQQPPEQQRPPMQATETITSTGVPVCSASEMSAREQRATGSVPVCCSSERSIKKETLISTPTTEDAVFEENRSGQFSLSAFTFASPR